MEVFFILSRPIPHLLLLLLFFFFFFFFLGGGVFFASVSRFSIVPHLKFSISLVMRLREDVLPAGSWSIGRDAQSAQRDQGPTSEMDLCQ